MHRAYEVVKGKYVSARLVLAKMDFRKPFQYQMKISLYHSRFRTRAKYDLYDGWFLSKLNKNVRHEQHEKKSISFTFLLTKSQSFSAQIFKNLELVRFSRHCTKSRRLSLSMHGGGINDGAVMQIGTLKKVRA